MTILHLDVERKRRRKVWVFTFPDDEIGLRWLAERGGDGEYSGRGFVFNVRGEIFPYPRQKLEKFIRWRLAIRYSRNRLRLTGAGTVFARGIMDAELARLVAMEDE
jgi:hypothetical protein